MGHSHHGADITQRQPGSLQHPGPIPNQFGRPPLRFRRQLPLCLGGSRSLRVGGRQHRDNLDIKPILGQPGLVGDGLLEQANLTELQKATARAEKAETAGVTATIAAVLSLAASVGNANFVAGTKPLNAN